MQVFRGVNSIRHMRPMLQDRNLQSVFMVTGKASYEASGAAAAIEQATTGLRTRRFCEFAVSPQLDDVLCGVQQFQEHPADVILAVGGGSVLDMAKLIAGLAHQPQDASVYIIEQHPIEADPLPIIAVPTTLGSGSEATHFAVVYVGGGKYSFADARLLPETTILDPNLTMSLPPYLTAVTGMDALAQAIESYWSVHSTDQSKQYAREAIPLILNNLVNAVREPTLERCDAMMRAAHLAGKAINIARTTACHSLSYAVTAHLNVSHGHAVALTLGEMFVHNAAVSEADINDLRGVHYVRSVIAELCDLMSCAAASDVRDEIREIMAAIDLEANPMALGMTEALIDEMVTEVNAQRLANNPRQLPEQDARNMWLSVCHCGARAHHAL